MSMRIGAAWLLVPAAIAALGAVTISAKAGLLPRGALWAVVQSCVLAKKTLGTALPCVEVSPASGDVPGHVVLRALGSPTHVIVVPTDRIAGIESAAVLLPAAGAYWRAAFAARHLVVDGVGGRIPLSEVGLAINSRRTRSQDQLHIHAECVEPGVLTAIRTQSAGLDREWRPLPRPFDHDRPYARRVGGAELMSANLFASLSKLPGHPDPGDVSALVITSGPDGDLIVVASRSRKRSVEGFLDESCSNTLRRLASR